MRVLVCGDRNWVDPAPIRRELRKVRRMSGPGVVIHGAARGADSIAGNIAKDLGFEVEEYPAQWEQYGRGAGPIRNRQMLLEGKPDLVLAFHEDLSKSKGTANMVTRARAAKVPVKVFTE